MAWEKIDGLASAIGVGKDNSLWIAGRHGKRVYKWSDQTWQKISFDETAENPVLGVTAGGQGNPWVITRSQEIFKHTP